jgi:hypothetical protein
MEISMKWDEINQVFRPGDYMVDLWWFSGQDALAILFDLCSTLQSIDPTLEVVPFRREVFHLDRDNLERAIKDSVKEFLQLRGDNKDLDSPGMTFRTSVEGIDLQVVLRITKEPAPIIKFAGLEFNEEHLGDSDGMFSNFQLHSLFRNLVLVLNPDYATLGRLPPIVADWYEATRVSIDTTKVPVAIEWYNFFSWDWVKRIGKQRFNKIPEGEVEKLPIGLIYIMQEEPFSYHNSEHVLRQERLHAHFKLMKLHNKYSI